MKDGTHCHIEFQFPTAHPDDLERFFDYNITVEVTFGERTETIIFNFSTSSKGACEKDIGETKKFCPKTFYLGDIDFEKELELIHLKLNLTRLESIINNEPLIEDGIKKGRKEEKKEIAKKLKGLRITEEISKITGLSISAILLL